ncbi:MAG TPA: hypothetical protein VFQ53_36460 [Kofleriaceae bacterium]|nr:hypothetical protein [Kofleriaceae bacterium]
MKTSELALELRARALVGETIADVAYQHLRWRDGARGAHDDVELAVQLRMASQRRFRIGWADEFGLHHGHGITVSEVRRVDRDAGPLEPAAWPRARIRAATIHWKSIDDALRNSLSIMVAIGGDHLRRADYPQTLQLDLDDGSQVFASAARVVDGQARGFTNHLVVVFSRAELDRLGL